MTLATTSRQAATLAAHQQQWGFVPAVTAADPSVRQSGARLDVRGSDGQWHPVAGDDPAAETAGWLAQAPPMPAAASLLCLIGVGPGHAVRALVDGAPLARLLVLEPNPAVLGHALDRHDWVELVASGRLMLLAGPDFAGRAGAWKVIARVADDPVIVVHPPTGRRDPAGARAAAQVIGQAVAGARANAQARERFAWPYLRNTLRNLGRFPAARDVAALAGRHAGRPAIVAAAGPSLNRNLDALAAIDGWRDRAVVIAVDTALKPMLAAGMAPHYVVGVDPGESNARTLTNLPALRDTWLVAEASLDPGCLTAFDDRLALFRVSDTHAPWPWLQRHGIATGRLRAWGSVLTTAYDFALHVGADPVIFIGADLAYTGGQPYCRGTVYEENWRTAMATGLTLDEVWRIQIPAAAQVAVADVHGATTASSPTLVAFRDWLAAQAVATTGHRVVNATGDGILHGRGIAHAALDEVLASVASPASRLIAGAAEAAPICSAEALEAAVAGVLTAVTAPPPAPLADWVDFTGGRATVTDLAEAVAETTPAVFGAHPPRSPALDARAASVRREAAALAATRVSEAAVPAAADRVHWRPASAGDWCFGPITPTLLPDGPVQAFRTYHALELNARRLEHLATLGLPLRQRHVLEIGAGAGDLTGFFLDRGCVVRVTDARPDHVALLQRRFDRHPLAQVAPLDLDPPPAHLPDLHDVVFCYGVLYHLSDPAAALDYLARACGDVLLLETVVGPDDAVDIGGLDEDPAAAGAAVSGRGCRPSRAWIAGALATRFPHVYAPTVQPNHCEYPVDWTAPSPFLRRAIFVAARRPLTLPRLGPPLADRVERH